jgi:hypothetical protein
MIGGLVVKECPPEKTSLRPYFFPPFCSESQKKNEDLGCDLYSCLLLLQVLVPCRCTLVFISSNTLHITLKCCV